MNIRMRPGSRGSIFQHWDERIGGILQIRDLPMRGSGGEASNAGLGMEGITGKCFLMTAENTACCGIMMRHCVIGSYLLRNSVILERTRECEFVV